MFLSLIVTFVILLSGALSADESISPPSEIAETAEPTVTISLKDGKSYSGRLLADYRQENGAGLTALEMRDGAIEVIHSEQIAEMRSTGEAFRPMTLDEAGRSLLDDLGEGYHLHQTKHFVIAHNTSASYALWCGKLFESLYSAFAFYQNRRGFELEEPEFPLMAVLLPNRQAFLDYAKRDMPTAEGIAAYFNRNSNRIVLYDFSEVETVRSTLQKKKKRAAADIEEFLSRPGAAANVTTIIHEATHQIAFNRGLFLRSGPYPLWAVEGLSMFFEVPDPRSSLGWSFRGSRGKVNVPRLSDLRRILATDSADPIDEILREENFHQDPLRSYSLSWGLYYYFQTKEPEKLARYLKAAASRPPYSVWSPEDRVADFEAVFGSDRKTLLKNFYKFIGSLE